MRGLAGSLESLTSVGADSVLLRDNTSNVNGTGTQDTIVSSTGTQDALVSSTTQDMVNGPSTEHREPVTRDVTNGVTLPEDLMNGHIVNGRR